MEATYGHVHLVGFFEDPLSKAITLVDHTVGLINYPTADLSPAEPLCLTIK